MSARKEQLAENVTLWLGDCQEVLPNLGLADAIITDPPYGIGIASFTSVGATGRNAGRHKLGARSVAKYGVSDWDRDGLTSDQWALIKSKAPQWIVWGGNHLAEVLGSSAGVLVWDKKCQNDWNDTFSEMEIAWTNALTRAKGFRHLWAGAIRASEQSANVREHPTQKPIVLMEWCLNFVPNATVILDPFMGSGTTGVASVNDRRGFIGIEKDAHYFSVSCRRISEALKRPRLFAEPVIKPVQEALFS